MIRSGYKSRLCSSCCERLFILFKNGIKETPLLPSSSRVPLRPRAQWLSIYQERNFATQRQLRAAQESSGQEETFQELDIPASESPEEIARRARQTFGDRLPKDLLSKDEFHVYERLYGPPIEVETGDEILSPNAEQNASVQDESIPQNVLMRESRDGNWEDVIYEQNASAEEQDLEVVEEEQVYDEDLKLNGDAPYQEKQSRVRSRTQAAEGRRLDHADRRESIEGTEAAISGYDASEDALHEDQVAVDDLDSTDLVDDPGQFEESDTIRAHHLTIAGRSGTKPSTLHLPKDLMTDHVTDQLAPVSNRQLSETARRIFGGPGLPYSAATIKKPNLKPLSIALDAYQHQMGDMEGNAYLAAVMPGTFASTMSALVEVRKRLGSRWLRGLMESRDGPRILDAGGGGVGVLAWRDAIRAEWASMHPGSNIDESPPPYGKSTVLTSSTTLRHKVSGLLDNTTFIPRLPDYNPAVDHPSYEGSNPQPRKQYDIIIAPHSLWQLREDYMRKSHVQNLWSLLDPRGGVLILIEKGVPRGFELIAGARQTLLRYHVSSPGSEVVELNEDTLENRFGPKEKGMIVAPCTTHSKCPMYMGPGRSQGRKDYCHFSQRYIRPLYLQKILNQKDRNHEDIRLSYVALQRGVDLRQDLNIKQTEKTTQAAFEGYESVEEGVSDTQDPSQTNPSPLTFPRTVLSPIKRKGHVIFDLCTPSGNIERWTVPRSFSKQAYRDARKAQWGDLWALGAKTRIHKNVRAGEVAPESQDATPDTEDPNGQEDEADEGSHGPRTRSGKAKKQKAVRSDVKKRRKAVLMPDEAQ